jgi:hypothetical protein
MVFSATQLPKTYGTQAHCAIQKARRFNRHGRRGGREERAMNAR